MWLSSLKAVVSSLNSPWKRLFSVRISPCMCFFSFLFFVFFFFTLFYACASIKQPHSVILLQIVMVSPGTHLAKDQSQNYWVPVQKTMSPKRNFFVLNFFFGLYVTMQIINLKTDSETLYYSLLEIKRTPSIIKHDKD